MDDLDHALKLALDHVEKVAIRVSHLEQRVHEAIARLNAHDNRLEQMQDQIAAREKKPKGARS